MGRECIFVPYNQSLAPLERLLSGVQRPGDYCVQGVLEVPLPLVEVEDVGVLSFPVPQVQIQQLIDRATRAPYGRGEATLLDESVRKVWQMPPEKVRIGGKPWSKSFQTILDRVTAGLGCAGGEVSAELYKLLIYDTGGFFTAHRDSEKTAGMFGTLVVTLPSLHRGGALIVRHGEKELTVNTAEAEFPELSFTAFYADCEHEVRPVTAGNRVCLVYNLIQRPGERQDWQLTVPVYDAEKTAVAQVLTRAFAAGRPIKLAWLLEHQYSSAELSFATLKNADAARVQVIRAAAELADCAVHLGIVHIEESGSAEPNYYAHPDRYHRSRWRSHWPRGIGDDDASSAEFDVIEVSNRSQYIDQWVNLQGERIEFGRLPIEEDEVLPSGALDDEEPDEQRLMEATGNEGVSFERSYHRAALVIWPRERFVGVLLQAGVGEALPYLRELVGACRDTGAHVDAARRTATAVAEQVIEAWEQVSPDRSYRAFGPIASRAEMIDLLGTLREPALLARFVGGVVMRQFDGSENQALAPHALLLEAGQAGTLLARLARENMGLFPGSCVNLLACILRELTEQQTVEWRTALCKMAGAIVESLARPVTPTNFSTGSERGDLAYDWQRAQKAKPVDTTLVIELFESLDLLTATELRAQAAAAMIASTSTFDPGTVIVPALAALQGRAPDIFATGSEGERLWVHAAGFLLARSELPPPPPRDWRQTAKLSCQCEDCQDLARFGADPMQQVHRFRMAQNRRSHVESQIRSYDLDMSCTTERRGSPHTLVCLKTRRTYQRQCEQHHADCAAMSALLDMIATAGRLVELTARLDAARERKPRTLDFV
jgi:hypothetical protein